MAKKKHYNSRDSYSLYLLKEDNPVDISDYSYVVDDFMKFLISKLLDTGKITFPNRLGNLQVVGKKVRVRFEDGKIKGLAPDWAETNKLWEKDPIAKQDKKLVYHFNEHTNNIRYRFFWSKARAIVQNKTLYNLKLTRDNKRTLSALIKQGKEYLIK